MWIANARILALELVAKENTMKNFKWFLHLNK